MKSQHKFSYVEHVTDDKLEQPPRLSVSKRYHNSQLTRTDEAEDFILALRPTPNPKSNKKTFTPKTRRVLDSLDEAFTTLEVLSAYLSQIEKTGNVTDWMEANNCSSKGYIKQFLQKINVVARLLESKDEADDAAPAPAPPHEAPMFLAAKDQYFTYRGLNRSLMLLAPMEIFQGIEGYSTKKVLGFVRLKGNPYPEMCALPGWTPCALEHPKLLDSEFWTDQVQIFAEFVGHKFTNGSFDKHHKVPVGTTFASHVEPKLILFMACREFEKLIGEELHLGQLWKLNRLKSTMEAEVIISEAPCRDCLRFKIMVEELTGLKFSIKLAPNLGQLKPQRDARGSRFYGLTASDDGLDEEPEDEIVQLEKPTTGRRVEVQIPARQVVRTITERSTIETCIQSTPRKRNHESAFTPPSRGTRSQVIVHKIAPFPTRNSPSKANTLKKRYEQQHQLDKLEDEILGYQSRTKLGAKKIKFY